MSKFWRIINAILAALCLPFSGESIWKDGSPGPGGLKPEEWEDGR